MIGTRILPEKFEQFLRERYYLEVELKNTNDLKSGNSQSKNSVHRQMLLNGLFLMRILHDPYFSLYVCKRIEQENFDLKDVLAYIQYVLLEKHLRDHPMFASSNPSADLKSSGNLFTSEFEDDRTIDELIKALSHGVELNNFRDNDYYWKLFSQASRDEEEDLLAALESIKDINRWISVRWQEDSPFSWGGVYDHCSEGLTNYSRKHFGKDCAEEDDWGRLIHEQEKKRVLAYTESGNSRIQTKFLYENIKPYFRQLYGGDKKNISAPFFAFLNFRPEFIFKIKTLLEKYGFIEGHEDRDIAKFLKFYMDSIFISQFFWFRSLGEDQKIELLNRYCDDLDICISGTNLNLFGKESLLHCLAYNEARKLYEERDYQSSIRIFDTVLKNTDYQYLKYLCTSWIAEIYQESNEYPLSLNYFEKAYSIANSFTSGTRVSNTLRKFTRIFGSFRQGRFVKLCTEPCFVRYLELSNMAVMYCHLKNKHKANECFEKLYQELQSFSIPKRILIHYKLASYFSGHQDLLKLRFLRVLVELADSYEDSVVDTIEEDMNEEVFTLLGLKDGWTREKCAQEWVIHMKSCALKNISDIDTTSPHPSGLLDKGWADLVTVYEDGRDLQCNPSGKKEQIRMILEASNVRPRIVFDLSSITPTTIEPRRSIIHLKGTIKELEIIGRKEDVKFGTSREVLELHDVVQRLKLECSRCYYVLDDLERAERILREILNDSGEEEVLFRAHCLLGLVLLKACDIRGGVGELGRALDLSSHEETFSDRCRDLFEICRDELICFNNKDVFYEVLYFIIDKVNSTIKNEDEYRKNCHVMAVEQFNEFGLTVEASHLIERGLGIEKNELVKVALLEEKAYLRYLDEDFAESENILNEIVRISFEEKNNSVEYLFFCSSAWHKISVFYARKREFKKAYEAIECAISKLEKYNNSKGVHDSDWKLKRYKELRGIYEIFSKDVITLSKINNKEVIDLFNTAEEIVLDGVQQRKNRDFDFSLAFVEYGKGLETYLHDNFSKKLRGGIFNKHGEPVPDIYWKINMARHIKKVPFELKGLLGANKKTINLGAWKGLINDAFCSDIESINNPYVRDSYEFIRNFMFKEEWYTIAEACAIVSWYRNGDAHYGKRPLKDVLMYREKIIEQINKVINVGASVWN
ncbi:hypothetical protein FTO70_06735 [Methanosarcina sp. KYL-1]|uniref:hypothetical protein n=1 Tax=Methanosarcina sp. KYL-1 TaxID=2602068 RepID=UPI0021008E80|nr:hypothetical protein [Methanosarcina sp. KYL-1]MCQ1535388.1 hypothetical protein [Methanosarcina sp. KYL-1]